MGYYCKHEVWSTEYCEECDKNQKIYEKSLEQKDWDYFHPNQEEEENDGIQKKYTVINDCK